MDPRKRINNSPRPNFIWYLLLAITSPFWLPIAAILGVPVALIYIGGTWLLRGNSRRRK